MTRKMHTIEEREAQLEAIFDVLEEVNLPAGDLDDLKAAFVSRGKSKARLKRSCPGYDKPGRAAWQAVMGNVNPYKMSIATVMMLGREERERYERLDKKFAALVKTRNLRWMDRDREQLSHIGAW